jgi:hypothetical protein
MPTISKQTTLDIIKKYIKIENKENYERLLSLLDDVNQDDLMEIILSQNKIENVKYGQVIKTKVQRWNMDYEVDILDRYGLINNGYVYGLITDTNLGYDNSYKAQMYTHDSDYKIITVELNVKKENILMVDKNEPFFTVFKKYIEKEQKQSNAE